MATRREARERALGLCYELDARHVTVGDLLDGLPAPPDAYAETVVRGVDEHLSEIDSLLANFSERWSGGSSGTPRMPTRCSQRPTRRGPSTGRPRSTAPRWGSGRTSWAGNASCR